MYNRENRASVYNRLFVVKFLSYIRNFFRNSEKLQSRAQRIKMSINAIELQWFNHQRSMFF